MPLNGKLHCVAACSSRHGSSVAARGTTFISTNIIASQVTSCSSRQKSSVAARATTFSRQESAAATHNTAGFGCRPLRHRPQLTPQLDQPVTPNHDTRPADLRSITTCAPAQLTPQLDQPVTAMPQLTPQLDQPVTPTPITTPGPPTCAPLQLPPQAWLSLTTIFC